MKLLQIKKISAIIGCLLLSLGLASSFIFYIASYSVDSDNINAQNNTFLSIRYRILTDYFRSYYPVNIGEEIPNIELTFSKNDFSHIDKIQEITLRDTIDIKVYSKLNKWRKGVLKFNGNKFNIKWKAHGRRPTEHSDGNGYISLNIKMEKGEELYGSNHFRLIVYKRLRADMKIIEYLAEYFKLLNRKHKLLNIKLDSNKEHIYWFEDRLNNKYMQKHGKETLVTFTRGNEKSHILSNDTNINYLEESLSRILIEKGYNNSTADSIKASFKKFNKCLYTYNANYVRQFVDMDYITSFLAARMIGNLNGHGIRKRNLFIYLDTLNYKFYPVLSREEFVTVIKHQDSIDYFRENLNLSYFTTTLLMNNDVRKETHKKVLEFFETKGEDFEKEVTAIYDIFEARHFPDWVTSMRGLTHLQPIPYFYVNATFLKDYIRKRENSPKGLSKELLYID